MFNPNLQASANYDTSTDQQQPSSRQQQQHLIQQQYLLQQQQQQQLQGFAGGMRPGSALSNYSQNQPSSSPAPHVNGGNYSLFPSQSNSVDPQSYAQQTHQQQQQPQQQQSQPPPQQQSQAAWQGQQQSNPSSFYGSNNASTFPSSPSYPSSSTGLLQQQLLQQQLLQQQQQHQLLQHQQQQQSQSNQAPPPPPPQQTPQQQPPQQTQQSPPLQALLNSLTHEKFNQLAPAQQAILRQYIAKQKAEAQGGIGLGHPVGPPSTVMSQGVNGLGGLGGAPGYNYPNRAPTENAQPLSSYPAQSPSTAQAANQASNNVFMRALVEFNAKQGTPLNGPITIEGRIIDLGKLYTFVVANGGFAKVHQANAWHPIVTQLGFDPSQSAMHPESRVNAVAIAYQTNLLAFEMVYYQRSVQQQSAARSVAASTHTPPQPQTQQTAPSNPYSQASPPPPANSIPRSQSRAGQYQQQQQQQQQLQPLQQQQQLQQRPPSSNSMRESPYSSMPSPSAVNANISAQQQQILQAQRMAASQQLEDKKGKGKSKEEKKKKPLPKKGKGRDESEGPGSPTSRQPSSGSTPIISALALPENISASTSTSKLALLPVPAPTPLSIPEPEQIIDSKPARRKRQKIEYVPLSRGADTYASWDLAQVEELNYRCSNHKRPRVAMDLGLVDVNSLIMAIRCRLSAEVAFALNSLSLISAMMQVALDQPGVDFRLLYAGDLLEELEELLVETAFGSEEERVAESEMEDLSRKETVFVSYRDLFRIVTEEETELKRTNSSRISSKTSNSLGPIETIIAITTILHNLSLNHENAAFMSTWSGGKVVDTLVRIASLPLLSASSGDFPLRISAADSMLLRKNVIETISNLGLTLRLSYLPSSTCTLLFRLLLFFLVDADHQLDQLYFDLPSSSASRINQTPPSQLSHYVDLGLGAFARVTTNDANRQVLSRLDPGHDLYKLFETLVHLLPVEAADFNLLTNDYGLTFAENLAMSLYNLAFLAPTELKLRLRVIPGLTKSLLRVTRRLLGTDDDETDNAFITLCDRCVATLKILSEVGGVSSGRREGDDEAPWYGMGMNGEEEDRPKNLVPKEADRGTIRARQPPAGGYTGIRGPPVMTGEKGDVLQMMLGRGGTGVFAKLVGAGLLDIPPST